MLVKKITQYKTYRCSKCGWRGMAAPAQNESKQARMRTILFWIAGVIIAIFVGLYAIYDLHSASER